MARADFKFAHRIRVRYSEIDGQAVVFNARYLDYADLAMTEFFRALGIPVVPGPDTPEFHAARAVVDFKVPIKVDEEIDLCVRTQRIGRTSVILLVEMHGIGAGDHVRAASGDHVRAASGDHVRAASGDDVRAVVELVYVHVDIASHRPVPVPAWVIERMELYAGKRLSEA